MQVRAALPWATTHHHQARCFAHMVIATLLDRFPPSHACWPDPVEAAAFLQPFVDFTSRNPAAQRLVDACHIVLHPNAADLTDIRVVLSRDGVALAGADGAADCTPGAPLAIEAAPASLMDRILECLHQGRQRMRAEAAAETGSSPSTRQRNQCFALLLTARVQLQMSCPGKGCLRTGPLVATSARLRRSRPVGWQLGGRRSA